MKKLIFKLSVLLSLVIAGGALILTIPGSYDHSLAAIINMQELLMGTKGRKLIFIGGSGISVGLDSFLVGKEFDRSAVNMGMYVGFGVTLPLLAIEPYIHKDDIIVVSIEYSQFAEDFLPNENGRKWFLFLTPENTFRYIYLKNSNFRLLAKDISGLLRLKVLGYIDNIIHKRNIFRSGAFDYYDLFNEHGDGLRKRFRTVAREDLLCYRQILRLTELDNKISILNEFSDYCASKRAKALFLFPAFPREEYLLNKQAIDGLFSKFRKELKMPLLGSPSDYLFPYDNFSNSCYHLRAEGEGAAIRTKKIIHYLKEALGQNIRTPGVVGHP